MLQVERLSIHFADREEVQEVVRGISFSVQDGEIVGIVGESGSGKTMTALTIAGLFKEHAVLDAGTIRLDGTDLLKLTEREMRQVQGNRIGMIFQEPMTALNPTMKIGRQVEEVLRLHTDLDSRARKAAVIRALEEVELDEAEKLLFKYPHELSGGMRQRVMIAAAMICRPSLLIADEPTTALDAATQESILKLLKKLNDKYGMSILFISHNLRVVKELCTRVFVMKDGEILEEGETEVVFQNPKTEYTKALIAAIPARVGENPYYEMLKQKAGRQYD
ncbi:MAG: ABC transporter ATP-binding protein [Schaedlerella sp.]|nr:ABC transporter ATP-binding protein [Lachnospiraceae bacterium]RGC71596.1 ABC transporter ATP-binding protein [Lachnospiraceae bacterium AM23-2LB]RJW01676.1 ABC transporter ATP-binding protein [Lachnospiraceae bacterium AM40-2BH]